MTIHERDTDESDERDAKRTKLDEHKEILPPSHALLGVPPSTYQDGRLKFGERDVGISEYIGRGVSQINGIIKQRFTDFLVFEVDLDGNIVHVKSLAIPESPKKDTEEDNPAQESDTMDLAPTDNSADNSATVTWPEHFTVKLSPYFSDTALVELKEMFLQGPDPPQANDTSAEPVSTEEKQENPKGRRERNGRGRGRKGKREDKRSVTSNPISSKADRTSVHRLIRELFRGKLDTETDSSSTSDDGSRIIVKWSGRSRGGRGTGPSRRSFPPFIHFTLQKTNRDTQDALNHLARVLHVNVKDLSVAGTKDKRGVTVQRVSLRRHSKTVEDIWRLANGQAGSKTYEHALTQRADRGIRVTDIEYRKSSLELGMLMGNAFIITLRNVQVDSLETLDHALETVKSKGFINYYGMQRFGTASVPTHAIGLALLKSEWQRAINLILETRHGEHPDVEAARNAWLIDRDLDRALALMPRRVVAERCILESYKKQNGDTRNAMGAFSTIPRNLRLMYVHAYQSYIWNAIVSERIRTFGSDRPVVGDLVLETASGSVDDMVVDTEGDSLENEPETEVQSSKKSRKPWTPPKVRTLTETDLDKYTIFDVVMPLPGTDVSYPGGKLGERYREILIKDGLDPDNFTRKQREYTLAGSFRKILHLPKELSWSVLRYTDPDVPLAQADEDKLLGFDPPAVSEDGKFMALQIKLTLGTAAYATMALREITKTETSSHFQTSLTFASEDQKYRGAQLEKD